MRAARLVLALLVTVPAVLHAQERQLGTIAFANTGAEAGQTAFLQGVLLLHSFEYDDAAKAFRQAQSVDGDFALAYWGEAMTYNHPLWQQQDAAAARGALARYAPTPEARQAKAKDPREAAYLAAVDVLYGPGTKSERDNAYMRAMEALSNAYPADDEARAFHSLAVLGSTDGERDFATYMRAAAVAQPLFVANPDHPGAAHYLIHSFDDPVHAPLGLTAARAYSGIAPDAAHAQHMTSHIFVALGMWDDVVAANIRARDEQNARSVAAGRPANVCGHYTSWLHYGWLMQGRTADAERGMADCLERVRAGGTPSEVGYFADMRARHVLDTGDWTAAARLSASVDDWRYTFTTGFAAVRGGDLTGAEEALASLRAGADADNPRVRIAASELEALLALEAGRSDAAIALLEEAAALEESLPFEFGPPASPKPPHELLGEVMLQLGDAAGAHAAFRRALEFTPGRVMSVRGLQVAADAMTDGSR